MKISLFNKTEFIVFLCVCVCVCVYGGRREEDTCMRTLASSEIIISL